MNLPIVVRASVQSKSLTLADFLPASLQGLKEVVEDHHGAKSKLLTLLLL